MPVYEYKCPSCNQLFEQRKSWSDDPSESCPKCQVVAVRQFATPTVIYKGSGFYNTDYRGSPKSTPAASTKNSATKSSEKSESGTNEPTKGTTETKQKTANASDK